MEEAKKCRSLRLGAVIIASGTSDRNGTEQALYEVKGMTLAKYVTVNFQRAGIRDLILITGEQHDRLKKDLKGFGVTFLQIKKDDGSEMMDSVKLGLKYLEERCDKVFVCPVDVPFFRKETILKLLEANSSVTIPSYQGKGGHSVLLAHKVFKALYDYQGKLGLKGFIQAMEQPPQYVETDDPGISAHVYPDTVQEELAEACHQRLHRVQVKVRLVHTKPYFGPGVVTLLREIHSLGAVREASEKTGISYSKAWTMIHTAEKELGRELVLRQPGGKNGGTAEISEAGWELIKKYEKLEASIEEFAAKEYQRIFEGERAGYRSTDQDSHRSSCQAADHCRTDIIK